MRKLWRQLLEYLGWSEPSEVVDGYPTTLDAYREHKRINAEQIAQARARGRMSGVER